MNQSSWINGRILSYSLDVLHKRKVNFQMDADRLFRRKLFRKSYTFRPLVKKMIDIYSITDCMLGCSSFSTVYLGYNENGKKKVAVKFIQSVNRMNDFSVIENEVNLLRKMKESDKIVRLYDFLKDEYCNCYMIFELADYNLQSYFVMNDGFFRDERNVCVLFKKIVDSLHDLHEQNIVHRDLKLENVFVFNSNDPVKRKYDIDVKIGDLGLSTICNKNQKLTQYCGSPLYSAPEVNKGIPYNGYKYDIWSLGIILYYLLYGYFPFNVYKNEVTKESNEDGEDTKPKIISLLFQKIQTEEVSFSEEKQISDSCKTLIQSLLNKNPENRPFVEEVITHPWIQSSNN